MIAVEGNLQMWVQADDDQATWFFHGSLRRVGRIGLLNSRAARVGMFCGPMVRPDMANGFRRASSAPGRVFANGANEKVTRPRVRPDVVEQECGLPAERVMLSKSLRQTKVKGVR
ncbi:MAG: hypothetical protein KGS60_18615 [Verrucomicrobia bacterium]|nr:hypothetical protein [Verrucomicrobiota bacterium]